MAVWNAWKKRPAAEWGQDRPARSWLPAGAAHGSGSGSGDPWAGAGGTDPWRRPDVEPPTSASVWAQDKRRGGRSDRRAESRQERTCFRCRKPGHMVKDCPAAH
eukprot:7414602-Prorocentrum_lima.AAC.1